MDIVNTDLIWTLSVDIHVLFIYLLQMSLMFKKIFTLIAFSFCVMPTLEASDQSPHFNLYNQPKKRTLRSYDAALANTNISSGAKGLMRLRVRYSGWYANVGPSAIHLPLPSFLIGENVAFPNHAAAKSDTASITSKKSTGFGFLRNAKPTAAEPKKIKNLAPVNPYSSLAIPFRLSPSEQNTISLEKYWFPLDMQCGYRISKNLAVEAALPVSWWSTDEKAKSIICLPNTAVKIIMPYDAQSEFFVKIGIIAPMAIIKKAKRSYSSNVNDRTNDRKNNRQKGQYHPVEWDRKFTWTAALGMDFKLNSQMSIHASLNGIGSLKTKEKTMGRSSTTIASSQTPIFIKVRIDYKVL